VHPDAGPDVWLHHHQDRHPALVHLVSCWAAAWQLSLDFPWELYRAVRTHQGCQPAHAPPPMAPACRIYYISPFAWCMRALVVNELTQERWMAPAAPGEPPLGIAGLEVSPAVAAHLHYIEAMQGEAGWEPGSLADASHVMPAAALAATMRQPLWQGATGSGMVCEFPWSLHYKMRTCATNGAGVWVLY
jgi:hypothetical protein